MIGSKSLLGPNHGFETATASLTEIFEYLPQTVMLIFRKDGPIFFTSLFLAFLSELGLKIFNDIVPSWWESQSGPLMSGRR